MLLLVLLRADAGAEEKGSAPADRAEEAGGPADRAEEAGGPCAAFDDGAAVTATATESLAASCFAAPLLLPLPVLVARDATAPPSSGSDCSPPRLVAAKLPLPRPPAKPPFPHNSAADAALAD